VGNRSPTKESKDESRRRQIPNLMPKTYPGRAHPEPKGSLPEVVEWIERRMK
jgi:hypothetical protein